MVFIACSVSLESIYMYVSVSIKHLLYILHAMLTELLYPLQDGHTPLHLAAWRGYISVERLLSTPGIDVDSKDMVS